jgi:hypothetical protein
MPRSWLRRKLRRINGVASSAFEVDAEGVERAVGGGEEYLAVGYTCASQVRGCFDLVAGRLEFLACRTIGANVGGVPCGVCGYGEEDPAAAYAGGGSGLSGKRWTFRSIRCGLSLWRGSGRSFQRGRLLTLCAGRWGSFCGRWPVSGSLRRAAVGPADIRLDRSRFVHGIWTG